MTTETTSDASGLNIAMELCALYAAKKFLLGLTQTQERAVNSECHARTWFSCFLHNTFSVCDAEAAIWVFTKELPFGNQELFPLPAKKMKEASSWSWQNFKGTSCVVGVESPRKRCPCLPVSRAHESQGASTNGSKKYNVLLSLHSYGFTLLALPHAFLSVSAISHLCPGGYLWQAKKVPR